MGVVETSPREAHLKPGHTLDALASGLPGLPLPIPGLLGLGLTGQPADVLAHLVALF